MTKQRKRLAMLCGAVCAVALAGWWITRADGSHSRTFRTATVTRGELRESISATGTLEPEEVVDVGAQIAGMIQSFGTDVDGRSIDHGSRVDPETVLARIDDALYVEEVNQARAQLAKAQARYDQMQAQVTEAEANTRRAEADMAQLRAKLHQAERDWSRTQHLVSANAASAQEYDTAEAVHETARAALAVGEAVLIQAKSAVEIRVAAVAEAKADIESAQAALNRAEKNLGYTTIKSPISGVIIDRRVNVGQTVVASFNAPSLFLIAKDLTRMEIWVSVNEADIGKIRAGQKAHFTVDTFPDQRLVGTVEQVRLNASMTQNVVSYTVIVSADNTDGKLLPYLTANVDFEIDCRPDVLSVPNAALRWRPTPEQVIPEARKPYEESLKAMGDGKSESPAHEGIVWVAEGHYVRPVTVKVGITNGTSTEVTGDNLEEGSQVVLGIVQATNAETAANPFMPKFSPRKKS